MAMQPSNETTVNASYLVNAGSGDVKLVVNSKTDKQTKSNPAESEAVMFFAKNTRYSINNNGGGYTGL